MTTQLQLCWKTFLTLVFAVVLCGQSSDGSDADGENKASRAEVLRLLALSPDHVRQIKKESILLESEAILLELLAEHEAGGGALSERQLTNLIPWFNRMPSGEAIAHMNTVATRAKDGGVQANCLAFFRNMERTRGLDVRQPQNISLVRSCFGRGNFASPSVRLLLARVLTAHDDADGKKFLVENLANHKDNPALLECAAVVLQKDTEQGDANAYLQAVLGGAWASFENKLRAAQILIIAGKNDGMTWLTTQLADAKTPMKTFSIGLALSEVGNLKGVDVLVDLLRCTQEEVAMASERALLRVIHDVPQGVRDVRGNAKGKAWKDWISQNRDKLRWSAGRSAFVVP